MTAARVHETSDDGLLATAVSNLLTAADARDGAAEPGFPFDAFSQLGAAGLLGISAVTGEPRPSAATELGWVRAVSRADGSVGRIFDGHLNAIERLAVHGSDELLARELPAAAAGRLWAGVWGGDPAPGEGPPAAVHESDGGLVLRGVKTFCSGAGGLHRALVLVRSALAAGQAPVLAWVDLADGDRVRIDRRWYRSHGLRASESHRVVFDDVPVIELLGGPGAISSQPWFARDALRTAASWAGMADSAVAGALDHLASRPSDGALEQLAAGKILAAQDTISVWLHEAARAMDAADARLPDVSLHARVAIAAACRELLDEAGRACGSRPFARGGRLDRARRDLDVFLLQHRLDPMLTRAGAVAIDAHRGP